MAVLAGCIGKAAHGVVMVDRKCCYYYCLASGLRGGVCRMRNDRGLPVGPYRVWLQERGYPGLAMKPRNRRWLGIPVRPGSCAPSDITPVKIYMPVLNVCLGHPVRPRSRSQK